MADRPGRSRDPGVVVRRDRHAPPRPPALHPQAGESAAGRQRLSARPEVALRVRLLPLHGGLRNYCAHHWARDGAAFAISGGRWISSSIWTRQNNARFEDNRGYLRTYAPQVRIAEVRKTLKNRRRFDAAARALADGAPSCSLVPVVDGYMRCLSANCAEWRAANPVPEPDGREHGYPRTALLELAREMRQASAARGLGSLGLVGGA